MSKGREHSYQWSEREQMWAVMTWNGQIVAFVEIENLAKKCIEWLNEMEEEIWVLLH